jgi:chemotaxis protein MotB
VPQKKYSALETKFNNTQRRLAAQEQTIQELEQTRDKLLTEIDQLQERYEYATKIAQTLYDNIQTLSAELKKKKVELEKRKSVIEIQDQVIKLLDDTKKTIESSLKNKIAAQEVELVNMEDKLKVVLIDKILYNPGGYTLKPEAKKLLLTLAESLRQDNDQQIIVEGHTDNVPLSAELAKKFPSNWELSAARAAAVARFLQREGGLDPLRLSVRGYSYYRPVVPNSTEEGRRQNRRIEIILEPYP